LFGQFFTSKSKLKDQDWINENYLNEKVMDIVGGKKIELEGALKIEDFTKLRIISLKKLELSNLKISGCSQLIDIDLFELSLLKSLSVTNCSNLTSLSCSTNELTSLEIIYCPQLNQITRFSEFSKLMSLSVISCPKLTRLDCSNTKLTKLEVSDLDDLIELNCSNTSIKELSLNFCPNIKQLDCSNNKKLINLDASNCLKLEFLDCSNSKLTSLGLSYRPKEKINILLVGITGSGKSALANVLTNSDDFKESAYAVSETKNFRKKSFKWNGKYFCVVDTVGLGNIALSTKRTLSKIAEGIIAMPEGINHVLFVIRGSPTQEEINMFNLVKDTLFNSSILDYVTIVRTFFSDFENRVKCEIEANQMLNIFNSCNDVICVNNSSINLAKADYDDDYEYRAFFNNNNRNKSRKIVLDHLDKKSHEEPFKLGNRDELYEKINDYLKNNNLDDVICDNIQE
jgi:hypothetical protein